MKQFGKIAALTAAGLVLLFLVALFGGMETAPPKPPSETPPAIPQEEKKPASGSHSSSRYDSDDRGDSHTGSESVAPWYSYGGSTSGYGGADSYNEGYDDLYFGDDYDQDRYDNDPDYAMGVDDAMEDDDW